MLELIYLYNTFLIIFYSVIMSFSINCFVKEKEREKKKLYFILILYFLFFIIDNLVISMTELITSFETLYNTKFMGVSLIKTTVYVVNNYCQIWIVNYIKKQKYSLFQYAFLICVFLFMIIIPMFPSSALNVYIYYSVNQIFLIYVGLLAVKGIRRNSTLSPIRMRYLKLIFLVCTISAIAILLEDTFVIFNVDRYRVLDVKIQNRNISEDIFSIIVCMICLKYFLELDDSRSYHSIACQQGAHHLNKQVISEKDEGVLENEMSRFFDLFHLTEREREICSLLLKYKQNSEIAKELFLALGTVKTHIHNIYIKMNIKSRSQIFHLYDEFIKKN